MARPLDIALPVHDAPCERADAARNRGRLLEAARTIIDRDGVGALTMQAVADAAGVGKGTLFRRFADRAGLLHALLDEDERLFQDQIIGGPPPLGPGAAPVDRLAAFGRARLAFVLRHGAVLRAADRSRCQDTEHPVHVAHRMHLGVLLGQAGVPPQHSAYLATVLLAALDPALVLDQQARDGLPLEDLAAGWERLARAAVTQAA